MRIIIKPVFILTLLCLTTVVKAQFLMDLIDTTTELGRSVMAVSKRFDNISFGGYIQPQFQYITAKGAKSYAGGDFLPNVNNRFTLRRGRFRFDYLHRDKQGFPEIQLVFQFDGSERGVFIRDFFLRTFESRFKMFALTVGMFARPISYELNLSSADRESPERGRMSQILMRTERDLGAMISFEPKIKDHPLRYLKIDAGLFNGPGLSAPADYDSHKDFITRVGLKPYPITKNLKFSIAASYLNGGFLQNSKYAYHLTNASAGKAFIVDSSSGNIGHIVPRKYYGADAQLKLKTKAGFSEIRAEYMMGRQTSYANTSETPGALLAEAAGALYFRKFNGAYFYFLNNIFNKHHQLCIKYDWYDPNTEVSGKEIGNNGNNVNEANIKYSTLGFGYIHHLNESLKLVLWYDVVKNESTSLTAYSHDVKDDVLTCRLQFRF